MLTKRNGPVPIGFRPKLLSEPRGTMPIAGRAIDQRNEAYASRKWNTTVKSSGASIDSTRLNDPPRFTVFTAPERMESNVNFTSADVNGRPSWNFTPWRRWKI